MAPKISVIIPVYKVETYLSECLESIERQTFQDFELILVDDGSPDGCGAMCDAYASNHPNTRVIHQANMGLSGARNHGAKAARGEYIVFVDSDDYVSSDHLEYLLYLIEKYQADVSVAKVVTFTDGQIPSKMQTEQADCVMSPAEALKQICYGAMGIFACGKMYRSGLVRKFPYPEGQLYEDTATTYKIVGAAGRIAYGSRNIYYWRQHKDSITHSMITEKHLFGITAAKEQLAYMEKHYEEAVPAARARCVMKMVDLSYRLVMGAKDRVLFERVRAEIKPFLRPFLADPEASGALKLRALALYLGYIPYLLISKGYAAIK